MIATYRLQLTPEFGFAEARAVVPYLRELGISHLYLSPVLEARHGSTHGYDVVDPGRVSEQLGGEDGLRELCEAGLDVILDVVPNHMAATEDNPYWRDPELRRRFFDLDEEAGLHRRFFDIDELAGVRVEEPEVFAATHAVVLRLVREASSPGCASTTPTASPTRAATSSACARRASSTSGSRRSSSPASRSATGRSRERPATSSPTTCRRSSSTPPASGP